MPIDRGIGRRRIITAGLHPVDPVALWKPGDTADCVLGQRRPGCPVAGELLHPAAELGRRHDLGAGGDIHDPDVVQEYVAGTLSKPEVERAAALGIAAGLELEARPPAAAAVPARNQAFKACGKAKLFHVWRAQPRQRPDRITSCRPR